MHPAEKLWSEHHPPESRYPTGVLKVPSAIRGIAFFPGGYGLWRPDVTAPLPRFPVGGVMVLGHDFHTNRGYEKSLKCDREPENQPTWRALRKLLPQVKIDLAGCFFTNVFMGLRASDSATGRFPGANDERFVEHCVAFLEKQVLAQQPSVILTLGIYVPPLLARISPDLSEWAIGSGFRHLDNVGPVRLNAHMGADRSVKSHVVALTHPSMRNSNVRHRRYRGLSGDAAEVRMLQEALNVTAAQS